MGTAGRAAMVPRPGVPEAVAVRAALNAADERADRAKTDIQGYSKSISHAVDAALPIDRKTVKREIEERLPADARVEYQKEIRAIEDLVGQAEKARKAGEKDDAKAYEAVTRAAIETLGRVDRISEQLHAIGAPATAESNIRDAFWSSIRDGGTEAETAFMRKWSDLTLRSGEIYLGYQDLMKRPDAPLAKWIGQETMQTLEMRPGREMEVHTLEMRSDRLDAMEYKLANFRSFEAKPKPGGYSDADLQLNERELLVAAITRADGVVKSLLENKNFGQLPVEIRERAENANWFLERAGQLEKADPKYAGAAVAYFKAAEFMLVSLDTEAPAGSATAAALEKTSAVMESDTAGNLKTPASMGKAAEEMTQGITRASFENGMQANGAEIEAAAKDVQKSRKYSKEEKEFISQSLERADALNKKAADALTQGKTEEAVNNLLLSRSLLLATTQYADALAESKAMRLPSTKVRAQFEELTGSADAAITRMKDAIGRMADLDPATERTALVQQLQGIGEENGAALADAHAARAKGELLGFDATRVGYAGKVGARLERISKAAEDQIGKGEYETARSLIQVGLAYKETFEGSAYRGLANKGETLLDAEKRLREAGKVPAQNDLLHTSRAKLAGVIDHLCPPDGAEAAKPMPAGKLEAEISGAMAMGRAVKKAAANAEQARRLQSGVVALGDKQEKKPDTTQSDMDIAEMGGYALMGRERDAQKVLVEKLDDHLNAEQDAYLAILAVPEKLKIIEANDAKITGQRGEIREKADDLAQLNEKINSKMTGKREMDDTAGAIAGTCNSTAGELAKADQKLGDIHDRGQQLMAMGKEAPPEKVSKMVVEQGTAIEETGELLKKAGGMQAIGRSELAHLATYEAAGIGPTANMQKHALETSSGRLYRSLQSLEEGNFSEAAESFAEAQDTYFTTQGMARGLAYGSPELVKYKDTATDSFAVLTGTKEGDVAVAKLRLDGEYALTTTEVRGKQLLEGVLPNVFVAGREVFRGFKSDGKTWNADLKEIGYVEHDQRVSEMRTQVATLIDPKTTKSEVTLAYNEITNNQSDAEEQHRTGAELQGAVVNCVGLVYSPVFIASVTIDTISNADKMDAGGWANTAVLATAIVSGKLGALTKLAKEAVAVEKVTETAVKVGKMEKVMQGVIRTAKDPFAAVHTASTLWMVGQGTVGAYQSFSEYDKTGDMSRITEGVMSIAYQLPIVTGFSVPLYRAMRGSPQQHANVLGRYSEQRTHEVAEAKQKAVAEEARAPALPKEAAAPEAAKAPEKVAPFERLKKLAAEKATKPVERPAIAERPAEAPRREEAAVEIPIKPVEKAAARPERPAELVTAEAEVKGIVDETVRRVGPKEATEILKKRADQRREEVLTNREKLAVERKDAEIWARRDAQGNPIISKEILESFARREGRLDQLETTVKLLDTEVITREVPESVAAQTRDFPQADRLAALERGRNLGGAYEALSRGVPDAEIMKQFEVSPAELGYLKIRTELPPSEVPGDIVNLALRPEMATVSELGNKLGDLSNRALTGTPKEYVASVTAQLERIYGGRGNIPRELMPAEGETLFDTVKSSAPALKKILQSARERLGFEDNIYEGFVRLHGETGSGAGMAATVDASSRIANESKPIGVLVLDGAKTWQKNGKSYGGEKFQAHDRTHGGLEVGDMGLIVYMEAADRFRQQNPEAYTKLQTAEGDEVVVIIRGDKLGKTDAEASAAIRKYEESFRSILGQVTKEMGIGKDSPLFDALGDANAHGGVISVKTSKEGVRTFEYQGREFRNLDGALVSLEVEHPLNKLAGRGKTAAGRMENAATASRIRGFIGDVMATKPASGLKQLMTEGKKTFEPDAFATFRVGFEKGFRKDIVRLAENNGKGRTHADNGMAGPTVLNQLGHPVTDTMTAHFQDAMMRTFRERGIGDNVEIAVNGPMIFAFKFKGDVDVNTFNAAVAETARRFPEFMREQGITQITKATSSSSLVEPVGTISPTTWEFSKGAWRQRELTPEELRGAAERKAIDRMKAPIMGELFRYKAAVRGAERRLGSVISDLHLYYKSVEIEGQPAVVVPAHSERSVVREMFTDRQGRLTVDESVIKALENAASSKWIRTPEDLIQHLRDSGVAEPSTERFFNALGFERLGAAEEVRGARPVEAVPLGKAVGAEEMGGAVEIRLKPAPEEVKRPMVAERVERRETVRTELGAVEDALGGMKAARKRVRQLGAVGDVESLIRERMGPAEAKLEAALSKFPGMEVRDVPVLSRKGWSKAMQLAADETGYLHLTSETVPGAPKVKDGYNEYSVVGPDFEGATRKAIVTKDGSKVLIDKEAGAPAAGAMAPRAADELTPAARELHDAANAPPEALARYWPTAEPQMRAGIEYMMTEGSAYASATPQQRLVIAAELGKSIESQRAGSTRTLPSPERLAEIAKMADSAAYEGRSAGIDKLNAGEAMAFGWIKLQMRASGTRRSSDNYVPEYQDAAAARVLAARYEQLKSQPPSANALDTRMGAMMGIERQHPAWTAEQVAAEYVKSSRDRGMPVISGRAKAPEAAPGIAPATPEAKVRRAAPEAETEAQRVQYERMQELLENGVPGEQAAKQAREEIGQASRIADINKQMSGKGLLKRIAATREELAAAEGMGRIRAEPGRKDLTDMELAMEYMRRQKPEAALRPAEMPAQPDHMSQYRLRQEAGEKELTRMEQDIARVAKESSPEGRRLYLAARELEQPAGSRRMLGTANERAVATQMASDPAYLYAIRKGDAAAALAVAEKYAPLSRALEQNTTEISRGQYVDVVKNAPKVVAIGDLHGDAYSAADQLLRGGILVDTRPDLPNSDTSVLPAERYRLNPDLQPGTQIVFTGDFMDRGPTSVEAVELVRRIQQDAAAVGVDVHTIKGNHEASFMQFAEAYKGLSTEEAYKAASGQLGDAFTVVSQWKRVGMEATFKSIVNNYGSWENFVKQNYDAGGSIIKGSMLEFISSTKGAVIVDNNYFTHGGPVVSAASPEALDAHFRQVFSKVQNHWASVHGDLKMVAAGDYSLLYASQWIGMTNVKPGEMQKLQEWKRAMGVDHIYVGHEAGENVRMHGDVTIIDAGMSSGYYNGKGYVVIDPVERQAPVRVEESKAAKPEEFGIRDKKDLPRDITEGRARGKVLDNGISAVAEKVYGEKKGGIAAPPGEGGKVSQETIERAVLGLRYEAQKEYVAEHFKGATPDAVTLDNALIVMGERNGDRKQIFGDFKEVGAKESIGGNAGAMRFAVNGYYNPATGKILAFGNVQDIPAGVREKGKAFSLVVDLNSGKIDNVHSETVVPSLAALKGMRVAEEFVMPGNIEAPAAGGKMKRFVKAVGAGLKTFGKEYAKEAGSKLFMGGIDPEGAVKAFKAGVKAAKGAKAGTQKEAGPATKEEARLSQVQLAQQALDIISGAKPENQAMRKAFLESVLEVSGINISDIERASLSKDLAAAAKLPATQGVRWAGSVKLNEPSGYPGIFLGEMATADGRTITFVFKARDAAETMLGTGLYKALGMPHPKSAQLGDTMLMQQYIGEGEAPENFLKPNGPAELAKLTPKARQERASERARLFRDFGESGAVDYAVGIPDSHLNQFVIVIENNEFRALRVDFENPGLGWGYGIGNPIRDHEKLWKDSLLLHYEPGDLRAMVQGIEEGLARIGKLSGDQMRDIGSMLDLNKDKEFGRGRLSDERIQEAKTRIGRMKNDPEMAKYEMIEYMFDIWRRASVRPEEGNRRALAAEAASVFREFISTAKKNGREDVIQKARDYFEKGGEQKGMDRLADEALRIISEVK